MSPALEDGVAPGELAVAEPWSPDLWLEGNYVNECV